MSQPVSVQTSNMISEVVLASVLSSASGSLAAHLMNLPMGPIGGALFGAVRVLTQFPLQFLTTKLLNTDNLQASTASKTLARAIQIFGSLAATWGIMTLAGFALTVSHAVTLAIASYFCIIPVYFIINAVGLTLQEVR